MGCLIAIAPLAMDCYFPIIPLMVDYFHTDYAAISSTVSTYLLGYGLGQFFGGPFSDQIGRKKIAQTGMFAFALMSLLIALSQQVEQIQILRSLQGLSVGMSSSVCLATLRDVYGRKEVGKKFAIVLMVMLIAPLFAPFIGSFLGRLGWQYIFVFLAVYASIILVWYRLKIPETRKAEGKPNFRKIFKQYKAVITFKVDGRPIPLYYVLLSAFCSSSMMVFLANSSFIYMTHYGVDAITYPLLLIPDVIVMIIFIKVSTKLTAKIHPDVICKFGSIFLLLINTTILIAVLFFDVPLMFLFTLLVFSVATMGLVNPHASAVYIAFFNKLSGSAASFSALLVFSFGSIMSGLSAWLFDNTLFPIAILMFSCATLCVFFAFSIHKKYSFSDDEEELLV